MKKLQILKLIETPTMLATTRHFLPSCAPKMVSPPERRKRREAKIPKISKIPKE